MREQTTRANACQVSDQREPKTHVAPVSTDEVHHFFLLTKRSSWSGSLFGAQRKPKVLR